MKKLLFFILLLCTTNTLLAQTFNSGGINYTVTSTVAPLTVEVSSNTGFTGAAIIPTSVTDSGNTYAVTSIGYQAFMYCSSLTSVSIPNSVTSFGYSSFLGCTGLTSVSIPNSVTSISGESFSHCTGLTSVSISNSVTSIDNATFSFCTGLTSVTIPNSVTSIGYSSFIGCTGLTSLSIPNSVTSIGDASFANCTGLTSVTIPNSVTSIGNSSFSGCTGLTSVTVNWSTPLPIIRSVFNFINISAIPLIVPAGTEAAYEATPVWTDFIICSTLVTPTFAPIPPVCTLTTVSPLPTTSTNGITGTWSPAFTNATPPYTITTTTYTFTPDAGQCATTTTMDIVVYPLQDILFMPIDPICYGDTLIPPPNTSGNGITGTWSPAFNNTTTTTYTFTPDAGYCAVPRTLTIVVNAVTPTFTPVAPICSGDVLVALPTTSLEGITGTWSPALNNSVTTTYTFTPDAGQCATTTTLTIVVSLVVSIEAEVTACDTYTWSVNGTTYTTSGIYTEVSGCTTNILNLTLEVGTIWYADADGDGYGNPLASVTACILPAGFVADNTDCDDTNALINPCAKEIRTDGIDNNCNGLIDEIVTKILNSQCGALLSGVNVSIFAQTISGVTVTGWRFKVTEMIAGLPTGYVQILPRTTNNFQLKDLPLYAYNKTYMVQVSVQVAGVWHPYDNPCCTVRTVSPAIMRPSLCGTTLTTISDNIIAENVNFIKPASFNPWRFRVTDPSLASEVFDHYSRVIKLSYLVTPGFVKYNTTYTVEVAFLNVDGSWSDYSLPCTITTPPFPTTQIQASQCGFTATSGTQNIYATGILSAVGVPSMYRFRISLGSTFIDSEDNPSRSFYLNEFAGLLPSTTYNVDVSVEIGGVFGPYGSVCTITTPGVFRTIDEDAKTAIEFNAIAYPNPFENNFNINVTSNLESSVRIRVYDMLGKLIEDTNVESTEISNYEIGNNYPSGVYNVIVSQGEYYANTRVIKR